MKKNCVFKDFVLILILIILISFKTDVNAAYQNGYNIKMTLGETYTISDEENVINWSSSKNGNVSVDSNGTLTAILVNYNTIITGTYEDGSEVNYNVEVVEKPLYSTYSINQKEGKYIYLNDDYDNATYSSSNESIFTIEDVSISAYYVKIKGHKPGTATLTVTTETGTYKAKITVNKTFTFYDKIYSVKKGEKVYIDLPSNFEDITWSSQDESIASLELYSSTSRYSRYIVGNKVGNTKITAVNEYGETASCTVRVYSDYTSINLPKTEYNLYTGQSVKIAYTINPNNTNSVVEFKKGYYYYYDDDGYTLTSNGTITALKEGYYHISMYVNDSYYETITVNITAPSFTKSSYEIYKNKTFKLPLTGYHSKVTFTSSNPSVVTVDKYGNIKGIKAGSAVITATAGKYKAKTTVKVLNPKFQYTKYQVYQYKSAYLKIIGGTGTVTWKSANTKIATVDKNGKVTAINPGTVTIYATVSNVTIKTQLIVNKPTLSVKTKTLVAKQSYQLYVYGGKGTIKWSSSNKKVAKVSANGKVTALKKGTSIITAIVNGKKLTAKINVINNAISYYVDTNVNSYYYGNPTVKLKSVAYSGNDIIANVYVINNRMFYAKKFKYITLTLYGYDGNVIATKKFTNKSLKIKPYRSKKISFKFTGKSVKNKSAILNNGVYMKYNYYYTYVI